jgi:hypothetical protein
MGGEWVVKFLKSRYARLAYLLGSLAAVAAALEASLKWT